MIKYKLSICWSEEDQAFIAEVPELSGCLADGKTYQEAVRNAERAIAEWIETASEESRKIPKSKRCSHNIIIRYFLWIILAIVLFILVLYFSNYYFSVLENNVNWKNNSDRNIFHYLSERNAD
jgi:predicted RNase H-like HicB family nuclease